MSASKHEHHGVSANKRFHSRTLLAGNSGSLLKSCNSDVLPAGADGHAEPAIISWIDHL